GAARRHGARIGPQSASRANVDARAGARLGSDSRDGPSPSRADRSARRQWPVIPYHRFRVAWRVGSARERSDRWRARSLSRDGGRAGAGSAARLRSDHRRALIRNTLTPTPERLVLLGHPLGHTLSPLFQNAALRAAGIK